MTGWTCVLVCSVALTTVATVLAQPAGEASIDPAAELIRSIVRSGRHPSQRWPLLRDAGDALQAIYDGGAAPIWSADGQLIPASRQPIRQLVQVDGRDLVPSDYDAVRLEALAAMSSLAPAARAQQRAADLALNADRGAIASAPRRWWS